ncbi:F-box protein CPR1 [Linum perenne]
MSDYIPTEVLTNILKRITGVRDLVRWRRVSKQWQSLIDSPDFIQGHLDRSSLFTTPSKLGFFVQTSRSCLLYQPENTRRILYPGSVNLIGTSNGLICFHANSEPHPQILNPSTGERRYFHTFSSRQIGSEPVLNKYGFGYDELSDDYKLVVIHDRKAEIYSIRARKRRTIEFPFGDLIPEPKGVLVCGALHWIGRDGALYAIDLATETARRLAWAGFNGQSSVGVLFGCLCILCIKNWRRVELLMMSDYGNRNTWYRICNTDFGRVIHSVSLVGSSWNGRLLFLLNGTELLWFHPFPEEAEDAGVEVINVDREDGFISDAFFCVDSLVKIFPEGRRI